MCAFSFGGSGTRERCLMPRPPEPCRLCWDPRQQRTILSCSLVIKGVCFMLCLPMMAARWVLPQAGKLACHTVPANDVGALGDPPGWMCGRCC